MRSTYLLFYVAGPFAAGCSVPAPDGPQPACGPAAFARRGPARSGPGGGTNRSFELSTHPGMDGPHGMPIHVPVQHADGSTETVALSVVGDFRG